MQLNRENILKRTHQGLHIYSYVLQQLRFPEKLRLIGNTCLPSANPYNSGRKTLVVEIREGLARHWDLELDSFQGDAFDFANLYFKMASLEELYYMINQVMHLGLKVAAENNLSWLDLQDDSWRPLVSYFAPPIRNTDPSECLSLREVHDRIKGDSYKKITTSLRALPEGKEKSRYKSEHFPYVTFSGVFNKRNDQGLKKASDLMVFDFDHLKDPAAMKLLLLGDDFFDTELLFISPSGQGLKWVIRQDKNITPCRNTFFRGVAAYLKKRYGLEADPSGKDLSRACYLVWDPEIFLNPRHWGVVKK